MWPVLELPLRPPLAPMEARRVRALPDDAGWQFEPKWDGFRCLAFRDGAAVALQSKAGQPLGRSEVDRIAEPDRLGARQAGGTIEAALVERYHVEVIPREAHRVLDVLAQDRLVGQPVDRGQRLGQRHRRRAPDAVTVADEGVEHDAPLRAVDREGQ